MVEIYHALKKARFYISHDSRNWSASDKKEMLEALDTVLKREFKHSSKKQIMVDELELPARVVNALTREKITTVEQLAKMMPDDIRNIRNIGKKGIDEIAKALERKGIV